MPSFVGATIHWGRLLQKLQNIPHMFTDHAPPKTSDMPSHTSKAAIVSTHVVAEDKIAEVQNSMLSLVIEVVKGLIGSDVAHHEPLMEAGLDSLGK